MQFESDVVRSRSPDPPPPGEESPVKIPVAGKDDSVPSKSRWETPESSPIRMESQRQKNKIAAAKEVRQVSVPKIKSKVIECNGRKIVKDSEPTNLKDEIFDNWDDDKLRAYLLKTKVQKIEIKPLVHNDAVAKNETVSEKKKTRKKSRTKLSNDMTDIPHDAEGKKEGRGRKKKRSVKPSRSSSSSR